MRFWIRGGPPGPRYSRRFVRAAGAEQSHSAAIEPQTDAVELVFREFQRLDVKQRARLWQRIWCSKTGRPDVTVDEIILKALEGGHPVTVNDVTKRFVDRVRMRLEKLPCVGSWSERAKAVLIASTRISCYGRTVQRRRSTRRPAVSPAPQNDRRTATRASS